jgi:ADP-ribosylglycohydrolase
MSMDLGSRLAGGVWGHLVGDALGVPYEFTGPHEAADVSFRGGGTWHKPVGTWSDDGALMLALLDSILGSGFDLADQGRRFLAWDDEGAYTPEGEGRFDIGGTTARALDALRHGTPAELAGPDQQRANGNGSLMRILPIALVDRDGADETLVEHAQMASRVTHGHPIAQAACALYTLTARGLLHTMPPEQALGVARETLSRIYAADEEADRHRSALEEIEGFAERTGGGYVVDAFWSAWDAFAGADSYASAVKRAVAYGNDTDTTASIAGGLAGIFWGIESIPAEWLEHMRGGSLVQPMVDRLLATAVSGGQVR